MRKTKLCIVSWLLAAMILTMLPVPAMAAYSVDADTGSVEMPSFQSMMPLEEIRTELDLTAYLPHELKAFPVAKLAELLGMGKPPAVYAKYYYYDEASGRYVDENDDFAAFDIGGTIDLYNNAYVAYPYNSFQLEVIAGTADQLALDNVRYVVTVKTTSVANIFVPAVYTTSRQEIPVYETYTGRTAGSTTNDILRIGLDRTYDEQTEPCYVGLTLNSAFAGVHAKAVRARDGADLTAELLNPTDMSVSGGIDTAIAERSEEIVFTLWRDGESTKTEVSFWLNFYAVETSLYSDGGLYAEQDGDRTYVSLTRSTNRVSVSKPAGVTYENYTYMLKDGFAADGTYYVTLRLYVPEDHDEYMRNNGLAYVKKAVVGLYTSENAIPASAPDIKAQLFSDAYDDGGYAADFSKGVVFTVVDTAGELYHCGVKVIPYNADIAPSSPLTGGTYLRVYGARKPDALEGQPDFYPSYAAYSMPFDADSYYDNGYQTVFLMEEVRDEETSQWRYVPLTADSIRPSFYTDTGITVYASTDGGSGKKQVSDQTKIPFTSGKAISYTSTDPYGGAANFWVTFLTQQSGPKLFVNAANDPSHYVTVGEADMPQREVFLNSASRCHDVFFANVGDAPIEGLYVRLENAENVKLDDYWTIGDTKTLSAFTTTERRDPDGKYVNYGELANTAKIRLVPVSDELGVISGTLVIGYTGSGTEPVEEVRIDLTGIAGEPAITTAWVEDGVKFVPYSSLLQTNSLHGGMTFRLINGKLPDGLSLKANGEIYGIPSKAGEFTFTVEAVYQGNEKATCQYTYTLVIQDNTNENVLAVNDTAQGYPLLDKVPDVNLRKLPAEGMLFRSEGPFADFVAFYLDGKKLEEGKDYTASEGSTRIVIQSQTFRNAGKGTHTIAAEFRTGGTSDGEMYRTAQNVTVTNRGGSGSSGSGSGSSSGSSAGAYVEVSAASSGVLETAARKIANGDMSYVSEVRSHAVKDTLDKGNGITVSIEKEIISASYVPSADKALLDKALGSSGSAGVYVSIAAVIRDSATGEVLGYLSQLPGKVQFTLDVPQSMLKALQDGKYLYAVRVHDGKAAFLDTTIRDGKASFSSDKFSTYALVVVDQMVQGVKTGDPGVVLYAVSAAAAAAAAAGVILRRKRREEA